MGWQSWFRRLWASFSYVGLVVGTLFFSASLSPSLLPRNYIVQGLLSGLALAVGYGLGVSMVWLWRYMELPPPTATVQRVARRLTTVGVALVVALSLWRATIWQNSIRELMEMPALESAYASYVVLIAVAFGALLIGLAVILGKIYNLVGRQLKRVLPQRGSYVLSAMVVGIFLLMLVNRIVARYALNVADSVDLPMATSVPTGYGHNYAPASYIDAWTEVTEPDEWSTDDTSRLKRLFAE